MIGKGDNTWLVHRIASHRRARARDEARISELIAENKELSQRLKRVLFAEEQNCRLLTSVSQELEEARQELSALERFGGV